MTVTRRKFLAGSIATGTGLLAGCPGPPRQAVDVDCPATVPTEATARIGFVGDVMLGRNVNDRWQDRPPAGVWGSTAEYLQALDGLVLNLECCVSDRGQRRPGRTYYFRADPNWAIPALQAAGTSFASLANNHVLDFERVALEDTLTNLSRAGIAHAGAGMNREAAVEPALIEIEGIEIAVIALTDQSPSYASLASKPGTAYADLSDSYPGRHLVGTALERARELEPDLTVATLHWGPNWETAPSEDQQAFARWLIDRGVDVVHGHSAHVIQGVEVYRGRPIIYDAGDFVDDYVVKPDLHNDRSFCFELRIADGRLEALDLVPIEIDDERVERASDEAATWLRDRMRSLSEPFETTVRREDRGLRIPLAEC